MLGPESRQLYSSCFATPVGHVFDSAVGATFSLELESLLFVLHCLVADAAREPEQAIADPVRLLEAIHRVASRVTLFCDEREIHPPGKPSRLSGLLEPVMVPSRARAPGGRFHPKFWVLKFRERDSEHVLIRVVVLSRNLAPSHAWDSLVCLEGSPDRGRKEESAELADLLRALPELGRVPLDETRRVQIEGLASEVHQTAFSPPEPFTAARFVAVGTKRNQGFSPDREGRELLAISPFVSAATLAGLEELAPVRHLIGRPDELGLCPPETFSGWNTRILDDAAGSQTIVADDAESHLPAEPAPTGLHVKALAIQGVLRTAWWIGSGNLTEAVTEGRNVELMVRLDGPTQKVGIQAFFEAGFEDLLCKYEHKPLPEDPTSESRTLVESAKGALLASELSLECGVVEGGWRMDLRGVTSLPEDVEVCCWPVTLSPGRALSLPPRGDVLLCFLDLSMEGLTCLFAFRIASGSGLARFETVFTAKLPARGIPAERNDRIARNILNDRAAFLRYLEGLLGLKGGEGDVLTSEREQRERRRDALAPFGSGLLERLLRAAHEDPYRLSGLRSLMQGSLADGSDEASILPDAFREVWKLVEPHLPKEIRS